MEAAVAGSAVRMRALAPPLLPVDSPHGRPAPEPSGKKWLLRTPGRGCGSGARAPREELQLPACRAAGGRQGGRPRCMLGVVVFLGAWGH